MKEIQILLQFDHKGKGIISLEFYQAILNNLKQEKVASCVNWGSSLRPPVVEDDIVHIEIPLIVKNDMEPEKLTIYNIQNVVKKVFTLDSAYSNLVITVLSQETM